MDKDPGEERNDCRFDGVCVSVRRVYGGQRIRCELIRDLLAERLRNEAMPERKEAEP